VACEQIHRSEIWFKRELDDQVEYMCGSKLSRADLHGGWKPVTLSE